MTTYTKIRQSACRTFRFVQRIFPITRSGCLLLTASILTIWTQGIAHQDLVLLAGAVVLLAIQLLLISFVIVSAFVAWWRSRRARCFSTALQLETGVESSTGFAVSFPGWLPFVTLNWEWTAPAGVEVRPRRQGSLLLENVVPNCRALTAMVQREFAVRDFLGLARISWVLPAPVPLRILPARLAHTELTVPLGLGTGDDLPDPWGALIGDHVEMREYQPGDSPRLVRWKLFARTGKLFVRTPERAIAEQPSACAWLRGGKSISAAAQLARELLERGSFGSEFLLGAEGSARVAHGDLELARDIIAESGPDTPVSSTAFPAFLQNASSLGYSDCLVFTGPAMPPEARELARGALAVRMVICVSELSTGAPVPLWKKIVFRREERSSLESIRVAYAPLNGLCPLQIFEQRSGSFFAL